MYERYVVRLSWFERKLLLCILYELQHFPGGTAATRLVLVQAETRKLRGCSW